jgi:hypothetical protein
MLRNVFLILVLTALAATSTLASPARSAKTHSHASKTALHHASAHAAAQKRQPLLASRHGRRAAARRIERVSFRRRHAIIFASPLKGSLESLTRQNEMSEAEGLERILDEDDLADRITQGLLVPVPASSALAVNETLPLNHRYCRPWTADFLTELAQAHTVKFRRPLLLSSAVRTVEYQKHLMLRNGNAAAAEGDIVSPHLTGATIDIAKQGMSRQELKWMRDWLLPLQNEGKIDVEEEFKQSCFHITVYKSYEQAEPESPSHQVDASESASSHGV